MIAVSVLRKGLSADKSALVKQTRTALLLKDDKIHEAQSSASTDWEQSYCSYRSGAYAIDIPTKTPQQIALSAQCAYRRGDFSHAKELWQNLADFVSRNLLFT